VSGLALPPAEPPQESIRALLERLRTAQQHLDDAERQEHMIDQALADVETLEAAGAMYFRIERRVARNRTLLWTREVRALQRRGRAMGLAV
jgi:hypothetical protein